MSSMLLHVAERVLNVPLLAMPEKVAVIAHVLEGRIAIDASELGSRFETYTAPKALVGDFQPVDPANPSGPRKLFRTVARVAVIPVIGSLVNRGGYLDALSGLTSYEKIKLQVRAAAADDDVAVIMLDIDSGGGEAIGAFEAGDAVRAASRVKPVYAVANGLCCSAAYAIASGASRIYATKSSVTGSIGTALLHLDRSKRIADMGIKPTLFVTGKRKGDGSPFFELSDEVKDELASYVRRVNQNFIRAVVEHRGLTAEAVLAQEAGIFVGAEGITAGLVDEIGDFDELVLALRRKYPAPVRTDRVSQRYLGRL